jgi:GMP synthase (glutamine-hydrolysing)
VQIDVFRQQSLPAAENLAGIVITGSAAMVSAHEQWSEDTAKWLGTAVLIGIPILGVCYGHQLLAHALGGHVGPNPAGRQIGTVTAQRLESTATDPLLGYLPSTFEVQTSHLEVVLELPPGAERLATSPLDDNFAIRFADNVWGVQFHPEFSPAVMSQYLHYREQVLRKEGLDPAHLLSKVTDTTQAQSVLQKFAGLLN